MKKFRKFIGILVLTFAMSITTMGATLVDVPKTHWAYVAIKDVASRGIMITNSVGQFNANKEMTFFEVADVLAKATGYVDIDQVAGITEKFKEQVKDNYEKQKPTLEACAKKYSTWNNAYNQEIAYLLGRGYIQTEDLDKFITKTPQGEVKNVITKEQLSVYVVRILGREKTATSTYIKTNFKDDSKLQDEMKPYVAYLNSIGILNPDANGNVNGTTHVTKAVCAKMVSDALKINDTSIVGRIPVTSTTTSGAIKVDTLTSSNTLTTMENTVTSNDSSTPLSSHTVIIKDIVMDAKNATIQSITVQVGDTTKSYTVTQDVNLNNLAVGENVTLTLNEISNKVDSGETGVVI